MVDFLKYFKDLFAKAKSRVKWDMELSEMFDNVYGMLQGGVISPSLLNFTSTTCVNASMI